MELNSNSQTSKKLNRCYRLQKKTNKLFDADARAADLFKFSFYRKSILRDVLVYERVSAMICSESEVEEEPRRISSEAILKVILPFCLLHI